MTKFKSYIISKLNYFDFYKKHNWGIEYENKYLKHRIVNSFARGGGEFYERSLDEFWFKDAKLRFGTAYFLSIVLIFFVIYPFIPHAFYFSHYGFNANICFELILFVYIFLCFLTHFGLLKLLEARA